MTDQMSAAEAAGTAKRARRLLRAGKLTHRQLALLDCLLWSCRAPGRATARVSYTRLCDLAHMARATVAAALHQLEECGLLRKQKVRIRIAWGSGVASRQGTSVYHLVPSERTEFTCSTVIREQEILVQAAPLLKQQEKAQEKAALALAEVRRTRAAALNRQWMQARGMA